MAGKRNTVAEIYRCVCRRYSHRVYRGRRKFRPRGHLKMIYCPACKIVRNFKKISF